MNDAINAVSDPTIFYGFGAPPKYGFFPGGDTGTPTGSVSIVASESGSLSLDFAHSGKDPLTYEPATPALDVQAGLSFTEDLKNGVLTINGSFTGNSFPSSEAFIVDQSGNAKVFLGAKKEQGGLLNLMFSGKDNSLFKVNMQIQFDDKGNFTGVTYDGKDYMIDEWNRRVQEGF
ncbi:MAG: hypothetical protein WD604_05375 [Balneolaceae bacterium]